MQSGDLPHPQQKGIYLLTDAAHVDQLSDIQLSPHEVLFAPEHSVAMYELGVIRDEDVFIDSATSLPQAKLDLVDLVTRDEFQDATVRSQTVFWLLQESSQNPFATYLNAVKGSSAMAEKFKDKLKEMYDKRVHFLQAVDMFIRTSSGRVDLSESKDDDGVPNITHLQAHVDELLAPVSSGEQEGSIRAPIPLATFLG